METETILNILQYSLAVVSLFLVIAVLLQSRSGGLGTVFGGSVGGDFYKSRRGFESVLYYGTIIMGTVFTFLSIAIAYFSV